MFYTSYLNESLIFSKKDFEYNIDEWKPERNKNILFITGLSGSGKSTLAFEMASKYDAKVFNCDFINHSEQPDDVKLKYKDTFDILEKYFRKYPMNRPTKQSSSYDVYRMVKHCMNEFVIPNIYNSGELYIVDGLQLVFVLDYDFLSERPVIIKQTSIITSTLRKLDRDEFSFKSIVDVILKKDNFMNLQYEISDEINQFIKNVKK